MECTQSRAPAKIRHSLTKNHESAVDFWCLFWNKVTELVRAGSKGVTMINLSQQVLRTDISGMPLEWIDYRDAVRLYHTEQVAYACGSLLYTLHGGFNACTGFRSEIGVNSIIATLGKIASKSAEGLSMPSDPKYR